MNDCRTTQMTRRTSRASQEVCSCGCGQVRFVLRELVSPDGLRWVLAGEQVFVARPNVGTDLAERKISVDMTE